MRLARFLGAVLLLQAFSGAAAAAAPGTSPRPEARPGVAASDAAIDRALSEASAVVQTIARLAVPALDRSPRPESRPAALPRAQTPYRSRRTENAKPGPICGDPKIVGTRLPPIPGRIAGCGVARPIRLVLVGDVALSQPATIDCATAAALKTWVDEGVERIVGRRGDGVSGLRVVAHYSCRTRNNRPGARISEHGRGHAIDIAAIQLADGTEISVLEDWSDRRKGRLLRRMHAAACGPFGTVLGPDADRFHQDQFHLDTARYRSGSYCR